MQATVTRPGPWVHRHITAGGTRFHVVLAGPEIPLETVPPASPPASTVASSAPAGPLVLLLHGFPECWWTWRHVIPPLADAGHRVAALDLRGFGGSDRPPSGYDLVTLAQDVAAVVRALGHDHAVVVGTGLGGQVGWTLANLEPELTVGLIPIGAPHPAAVRSLPMRSVMGSTVQHLFLKAPLLPERRLRTTVGVERLLGSWSAPATRPLVTEAAEYYAALLARPGAARSALESTRRSTLTRAEAAALNRPTTVPVLSVQGEFDPVQPARAHARDTHHVAGALQQVTIHGVGHFPQEEAPEALVDVLLPFLTQLTAPPRRVDPTPQAPDKPRLALRRPRRPSFIRRPGGTARRRSRRMPRSGGRGRGRPSSRA
ncbi:MULTISPECIES: alpha/beta hydrolase [unclassified Actinomyces]|uniref:alpha/beta fold hydrolase n=1 Tax=unclassified Actinomyces TaxID=2609248 RepID=UPI0013A6D28E|nr:alpha/beta hydrolase [Actinomyces sp. 594]MBW3068452.1 alpha/beta hydrolase [Actinomyces sp. 594]NDR54354.1 alpha/beta hydrolase [Actinomyces sp. 565]